MNSDKNHPLIFFFLKKIIILLPGLYQIVNIERKKLKMSEFKALAESERYAPPKNVKEDDYDELERKFW